MEKRRNNDPTQIYLKQPSCNSYAHTRQEIWLRVWTYRFVPHPKISGFI